MNWLIVTILAYFFSAIAAVFDKYLLKEKIPNPKIYSFYVGILGIPLFLLIPFFFLIPPFFQILISLLAGIFQILSLFFYLKAVKDFEVSRVVPTIGALTPLFVLFFTILFKKEYLVPFQFIALFLLLLGSFIINWQKGKWITFKCFLLSLLSSFLFSLTFFLSKFVYLQQPFWSGFILTRMGALLMALIFLFFKEVREELCLKKFTFKKETGILFLIGQLFGGGGFLLQNFAIKLVPFLLLPFINAMEGTKYAFLLIFTLFLSLKFPKIIKEEISFNIISQKILAIFLIALGLAILAFQK